MRGQQLGTVLRSLTLPCGGRSLLDVTDKELLRRFAVDRDEGAFAAVVRRHGGMVLAVCRRVLRHEQDAEDAFQATFLLLAQKPATLRSLDSLAGWLHGVARLTALNARKRTMRRRKHELSAAEGQPAASPAASGLRELQAILDEELQRLPERYRTPFVLCCLEGLSRPEAAAELGLKEGTVSSRLARARRLLQQQLTRRGVVLSAALCAVTLSVPKGAASVPGALAASTLRVANLVGTGSAAAATLPPHLVELTKGVLGTMTVTKLKGVIALLLVLGTFSLGYALQSKESADGQPEKTKGPATVPLPQEPPATEVKADLTRLAGEWWVKLPAGAEYPVRLAALGQDRYRLEPTSRAFGGVYELRKDRLVIVEPFHPRLTGFEWEVRVDGTLRLVAQPEVGKIGANYIGATLTRLAADKVAPPPPSPIAPATKSTAESAKGTCRVTTTLTSSGYAKMGGTLDRAIVSVLADPSRKQVAHANAKDAAFSFDLAPGNYVLECTGVGSRGATFVPTRKSFTVKAGDTKIDLGVVDLPPSKITQLFGQPAPEIGGVAEWKNTAPLTMKGLKGKVVVLDFWSYSCSICLHHKPDLTRLLEKHKEQGLMVLTVHDNSVGTMKEVDAKLSEALKQRIGALPVALDGKGGKGVFQAYGINAVPTVILIDSEGKVVRRFHHAGDPELDRAVGRLLEKK